MMSLSVHLFLKHLPILVKLVRVIKSADKYHSSASFATNYREVIEYFTFNTCYFKPERLLVALKTFY